MLDWLGREAVRHVTEAYNEKLAPGSAMWSDDVAMMVEFLPVLERAFLRCLSRHVGREIPALESATKVYLDHHRVGRLAPMLSVVNPRAGVPQRHIVYASIPLILFSLPVPAFGDRAHLAREAQRLLRSTAKRAGVDVASNGAWDPLRRAGVSLWERHCHG